MKIRLGTLRKIIREELKRANMKELKLGITGPMDSYGGAGFGGGYQTSIFDELDKEYGTAEEISQDELVAFFEKRGQELTNVPPRGMGVKYQLIDKPDGTLKLMVHDALGNDIAEVKKEGSGYVVEFLRISPEAMAGRALAASTR
jgi:hypothetical protein